MARKRVGSQKEFVERIEKMKNAVHKGLDDMDMETTNGLLCIIDQGPNTMLAISMAPEIVAKALYKLMSDEPEIALHMEIEKAKASFEKMINAGITPSPHEIEKIIGGIKNELKR